MRTSRTLMVLCVLIVTVTVCGAEPEMFRLSGQTRVHDPAIIRQGDAFYVFATGGRRGRGFVPILTSKDLHQWSRGGYVFEELPAWAPQEIPGTRGIWAPDISFFYGKYHLYYSVSTFGRNNSAIGLATNVTLDPNSPDYEWVDQGMVVRSREGEDDFNAIDGNIIVDKDTRVWLCWGSFWGGIMMKRIDPATGKLSDEDTKLYVLASRRRTGEHQTPPVSGAIEAPFLIRHDDHYYLFVSFDFCCRGVDSTYNIRVGRSSEVTGPYVDRDGKAMTEGGGTLVIEATTPHWRGPGHEAVLQDSSGDYLVFHAYDGSNGRSHLQISTIVWEDGWPRVAALP